ncbi:MAG: hypothetical protein HUU54_04520 [Ignavibacteriaceae bacterium]|nr:hypothetical protein [Ignavibacteriaceae bacterium]
MKQILMTGDSITDHFNTGLWLKEFNITNSGVSGNSSDDLLGRLHKDVIVPAPNIVMILIGTNDLAQGRSIDYISGNIGKIVSQIKASLKASEIFTTSVLPTLNNDPRPNGVIDELNKMIIEVSEKHNSGYIDLHPVFRSSSGELKKEFTYDGLHLNEAGYRAWAEYLRPILKKMI